MICEIGDKVLIKVKDSVIQLSNSTDYTHLFRLEVIGLREDEYVLLITPIIIITNSFELESRYDCTKYGIPFLFMHEKALIINDLNIVKTHSKKANCDGMNCVRCLDFFQFSEPNQEDGNFRCWSCRQNRYR